MLALLVTVGFLVSASMMAVGMHYLMGWEWMGALLFGALIAATDPVSVIATFKEAKIHGRLLLLVEAESLLNDGTAATTFAVLIALASGEPVSTIGVTQMLLVAVGGWRSLRSDIGLSCSASDGQDNGSPCRDHFHDRCRVCVFSPRRPFRHIRGSLDDHRRAGDEQL